jgi:hypothetical protein
MRGGVGALEARLTEHLVLSSSRRAMPFEVFIRVPSSLSRPVMRKGYQLRR